jgi:hypothetical protein
VRALWNGFVDDVDARVEPVVRVAVLEAVVRAYMRSRFRTHRLHSGLGPGSSSGAALRMLLKANSLNKANAVKQTTNKVTGAMAVVVSHFAKKISQQDRMKSTRGVAGLLNSHHGVTFAPRLMEALSTLSS